MLDAVLLDKDEEVSSCLGDRVRNHLRGDELEADPGEHIEVGRAVEVAPAHGDAHVGSAVVRVILRAKAQKGIAGGLEEAVEIGQEGGVFGAGNVKDGIEGAYPIEQPEWET